MAIAHDRQPDDGAGAADAALGAIRPLIPKLEDRRHALAGAMWRDAVLLPLGAAVAAAHVGVRGAEELVPAIVLVTVAVGLWLHARRRRLWRTTMIEAVMPAICRALGLRRYRAAGDPAALAGFEALGLVVPSRCRTLAHRIEGRCGDTGFTAQHVTLRRSCLGPVLGPGAFHGLIMRVSLRRPPPVRILIVPAGTSAARPASAPEMRLALGDARFEDRFDVLTPPLEPAAAERARGYLTPRLREALLAGDAEEAEEAAGAPARGSLRAAFHGDGFYLALPRLDRPGIGPLRVGRPRPFLDPGGVLMLVDLEETALQMARDADTPRRIVARLTGA